MCRRPAPLIHLGRRWAMLRWSGSAVSAGRAWPGLMRWAVPVGGTSTMVITRRHFDDRDDPYRHGKPDDVGTERNEWWRTEPRSLASLRETRSEKRETVRAARST